MIMLLSEKFSKRQIYVSIVRYNTKGEMIKVMVTS